jgi:hypothetical protein
LDLVVTVISYRIIASIPVTLEIFLKGVASIVDMSTGRCPRILATFPDAYSRVFPTMFHNSTVLDSSEACLGWDRESIDMQVLRHVLMSREQKGLIFVILFEF